ncbi:hypothetical protein HK097_006308 [Rhizophlyctis rosea]|uniref:Copper oxidase n=1 Tax=Rhizophlyctis rosea TaxID=64517 RepID=A0AAD5SE88_9FUNG|nr:hypothetical protein HK097_006308 [Rhizophlyctis rosea]
MSTYSIQEPLLDPAPPRRPTKRRAFLVLSIAALSVVAVLIGVLTTKKDTRNNLKNLTTQSFSVSFNHTDYSDLEDPVPCQDRYYDVVSLQVPIVYNKYGDVDPNGLMFALEENEHALNEYRQRFQRPIPPINFTQLLDNGFFELNPLIRPLVLRCNLHDTLTIRLRNEIPGRKVGMHVALDGHDVKSDGSAVGRNPPSLAAFKETVTYKWKCTHEGVFHIGDAGNLGATEDDTNLHGLFGALAVEPYGSRWTNPFTGEPLRDGLQADIHPPKKKGFQKHPRPFFSFEPEIHHPSESFREHVTVFHDEPEIHFSVRQEESPCGRNVFTIDRGIIASKQEDAVHAINYRSEPLRNRESRVFNLIKRGKLERPVYGEEQHHSSWMHGDPPSNILFLNYAGDPVKFRVVHGGVKETHVFHWHVHQWYAVEGKVDSPIIDSFSLSPQWATTFTALYGAGSRLKSIGDVIYHCHLYPHFSLGMWGIFRVFDKLQDGNQKYPNGEPIRPLLPLPGREPPPKPNATHPGFPNFINGTVHQKSPRIPWPIELFGPIPEGSDYRPATPLETAAMNSAPEPGNLFTLNPTPKAGTIDPETGFVIRHVNRNFTGVNRDLLFNQYGWNDPNGHMYQYDEEIAGERNVSTSYDPLVLRANNADRIQSKITNGFDRQLPGNVFDPPFPDCRAHPTEGEVGGHVHLVKFDVLVADGASVGWNYMSGARFGRYYLPLWWADREFGHVFFHDHLFANYRQKHGLYGIAPIEPVDAKYFSPYDLKKEIITGVQAVIVTPERKRDEYNDIFNRDNGLFAGGAFTNPRDVFSVAPQEDSVEKDSLNVYPGTFREWINFVGDFQPAFTRNGVPLNPPNFPGSDQDNGVMIVNYRSEPLRERIKKFRRENGREVDPADLFSSHVFGDPSTTIYEGYPGDNVRIRIAQGSHEESHSFNAYGFRWHDLFTDPQSRIVNQQILGISKAFTKILEPAYSPGDHLIYWRAIDDTWLGCWGLGRIYATLNSTLPTLPNNPKPFDKNPFADEKSLIYNPQPHKHREYKVVAESREIDYTEGFLGQNRSDPLGLIYRLTAYKEPGDDWVEIECDQGNPKPMVLRMIEGEYITIHLMNKINLNLRAEPKRPEVPVDLRSFRKVSSRVSIHSDLVLFDVRKDDGTNVGRNPDQTVPNGATRKFTWFADRYYGGPLILQDQSDFRNHRHHGLIGALLVEPRGWVPSTWVGEKATLKKIWTFPSASGGEVRFRNTGGLVGFDAPPEEEDLFVDEHVLILQDGLRQFENGNLRKPVADYVPNGNEFDPVAEDLFGTEEARRRTKEDQRRPWLAPHGGEESSADRAPRVLEDGSEEDYMNNHLRRRSRPANKQKRDIDVDALNWPDNSTEDPADEVQPPGSARNFTMSAHWPSMTNPQLRDRCDIFSRNGSRNNFAGSEIEDTDQVCRNIDPTDVDPEDQGQKAFNYRSAPTFDPVWLRPDNPPTPIFRGTKGRIQLMHLVAPNDKPRAISIHIHGHTFSEFENAGSVASGVDNAINPGRTESITFRAKREGDWAVRAGNVRSHITEGMWSILRVEDGDPFVNKKEEEKKDDY